MAVLNFRVEDDMKPKIEARAAEVRYRTVSDYLRELVEADLKLNKRRKPSAPRLPMPSPNN